MALRSCMSPLAITWKDERQPVSSPLLPLVPVRIDQGSRGASQAPSLSRTLKHRLSHPTARREQERDLGKGCEVQRPGGLAPTSQSWMTVSGRSVVFVSPPRPVSSRRFVEGPRPTVGSPPLLSPCRFSARVYGAVNLISSRPLSPWKSSRPITWSICERGARNHQFHRRPDGSDRPDDQRSRRGFRSS